MRIVGRHAGRMALPGAQVETRRTRRTPARVDRTVGVATHLVAAVRDGYIQVADRLVRQARTQDAVILPGLVFHPRLIAVRVDGRYSRLGDLVRGGRRRALGVGFD